MGGLWILFGFEKSAWLFVYLEASLLHSTVLHDFLSTLEVYIDWIISHKLLISMPQSPPFPYCLPICPLGGNWSLP